MFVCHLSVTIRPWTTGDLAVLRENASLGAAEVARLLGREERAVRQAAYRHRISLRRRGSRRGLVLGQPRGVSLGAELREDLLSGKVDAAVIARRMAADHDAELCPCCGRRPVRVEASGMCRVCHLEALAAHHLELLAEIQAQRELWTARQQVHREQLALLRARRAARTDAQCLRRERQRQERQEAEARPASSEVCA